MNERHLQICASAEWADTVRTEILPWALSGREAFGATLASIAGRMLSAAMLALAVVASASADAALAIWLGLLGLSLRSE